MEYEINNSFTELLEAEAAVANRIGDVTARAVGENAGSDDKMMVALAG